MKITILILLVLLPLVVVCGQAIETKSNLEIKSDKKVEKAVVNFMPDSSINGVLFLHNPSSTLKVLGDVMSNINVDTDFPDAYFESSVEGEEYLRIIFFPGNESNSLSQFEVGSLSLTGSKDLQPSKYPSFKTESGIRIGMSKDELIAIKGNEFKEEKLSDYLKLTYSINESSSDFLKKYNMLAYFAEYWFTTDDKLIKYKFGFEYP